MDLLLRWTLISKPLQLLATCQPQPPGHPPANNSFLPVNCKEWASSYYGLLQVGRGDVPPVTRRLVVGEPD
jgi:hypothetical protein